MCGPKPTLRQQTLRHYIYIVHRASDGKHIFLVKLSYRDPEIKYKLLY